MKSPIVRRKTHEAELARKSAEISRQQMNIEEGERLRQAMQTEINCLKQRLATAERMAREIVPKLVKVSIRDPFPPETDAYRVCVDIDPRAVEMCFDHGNDDSQIKLAAEYIGHAVYVKMVSFNFSRRRRYETVPSRCPGAHEPS